jgi:hypothetical protein
MSCCKYPMVWVEGLSGFWGRILDYLISEMTIVAIMIKAIAARSHWYILIFRDCRLESLRGFFLDIQFPRSRRVPFR